MAHRFFSNSARKIFAPALVAAAIVLTACADEGGFAPNAGNPNLDVSTWAAGADGADPLAGTVPDPATQQDGEATEEVCDGHDNDHNGEIDEGTGGAPCGMASGDTGIQICVGGYLRCQACKPGARRQIDCGCGEQRADTCDGYGVWQIGVCDGCSEPEPGPCGSCGYTAADGSCVGAGACEPGDEMYRRCDSCPVAGGCGASTCVGEKLQCNAGCTGDVVEPCKIMPYECERDSTLVERCGACGFKSVECDGVRRGHAAAARREQRAPTSSNASPDIHNARTRSSSRAAMPRRRPTAATRSSALGTPVRPCNLARRSNVPPASTTAIARAPMPASGAVAVAASAARRARWWPERSAAVAASPIATDARATVPATAGSTFRISASRTAPSATPGLPRSRTAAPVASRPATAAPAVGGMAGEPAKSATPSAATVKSRARVATTPVVPAPAPVAATAAPGEDGAAAS